MKVIISGSNGFVGNRLVKWFEQKGAFVYSLVRTSSKEKNHIYWDHIKKKIDSSQLEGADVVIHLAGENISNGRWTMQKLEKIRSSRICGTSFLCEELKKLQFPPRVFISASAIGYYGKKSRDKTITEVSSPGEDELAKIVSDWEEATSPLQNIETRVVHMRFGIILDPSGGALKKMLLPFHLGLGGKIGTGKQIMSWIDLNEIPYIIDFLIKNKQVTGAVNVVSPNPVSNKEFTNILGKILKKPTIFSVPSPILRILLGKMADYLLLSGNNVYPEKLLQKGYKFKEPYLKKALISMLNKL